MYKVHLLEYHQLGTSCTQPRPGSEWQINQDMESWSAILNRYTTLLTSMHFENGKTMSSVDEFGGSVFYVCM